ncbi:MAG: aminopeptidase P family N-terminal domain-containing protein, partial [Alphaproteobacteria bacterium]
MTLPHIHFDRAEFADRQTRAREAIAAAGIDGLLIFKIEDMYWLTGYDSLGFVIFDNMFIGVDGALTHVSRSADLANIKYSSICDDVRVTPDDADIPRSKAVKDMLESHGMAGKRIGIQLDTMGLTPRLYNEMRAALYGWCQLTDAPDMIRELRLVKSPRELDYLRKAGAIMDQVTDVAINATRPGAFEGDIYGAIYNTLFKLGADLPASAPPLGAGDAALNVRYTTGRHNVATNDQITYVLAVAYRHYHTAIMYVVLTGP